MSEQKPSEILEQHYNEQVIKSRRHLDKMIESNASSDVIETAKKRHKYNLDSQKYYEDLNK